MRIDYLFLPELPDKRHIILDGRRTVNTAAPPSGVIHLYDKGHTPEPEEEQELLEAKTPQ